MAADLISPVIVPPDKGECVRLGGFDARIIIPSIATGDAYSLQEYAVKAGAETPEVTLAHHSLLLWVVEGRFKFSVAGRTTLVGPDTAVLVPSGTPLKYENFSYSGGRMLEYASPGGYDEYLRDLATILAGDKADQAAMLNELNQRCGIRFR